MNLDKFLTQGLIESLNNGLIPPELVIVYAGNYLAKSLITADDMTKIQAAVTTYQAANASASASTSESTSNSETTSNSASTSESTSATATTSETASN